MRNYEERAKDFIEKIFPYIGNVIDPWSVRVRVRKFNEEYHRNVRVGNGLSRVALITSDYVIKWDYDEDEVERIGGCEREVKLYAEAEQDGFAYLFAKITRYEYNNRNFYIMPRIYGIRDTWDYANEKMNVTEKIWCEKHHLTDLHSNNFGYRKGRICIVDYACRDEDYFSDEEE